MFRSLLVVGFLTLFPSLLSPAGLSASDDQTTRPVGCSGGAETCRPTGPDVIILMGKWWAFVVVGWGDGWKSSGLIMEVNYWDRRAAGASLTVCDVCHTCHSVVLLQ